jgi:hypothetical protein
LVRINISAVHIASVFKGEQSVLKMNFYNSRIEKWGLVTPTRIICLLEAQVFLADDKLLLP